MARAWINELLAKITAPELAGDVAGAEALLARHAEYQAELQTRQDAVDAVSINCWRGQLNGSYAYASVCLVASYLIDEAS